MFQQGRIYRRKALHDTFGGQQQGGMIMPKDTPVIFLVTGEGGTAFGYSDGWEGNIGWVRGMPFIS